VSILLDTCVISELIEPLPDQVVTAWTARTPEDACFLSVITVGEVMRGISRLPAGRRRARLEAWLEGLAARYESRIVPIDPAVARKWGRLSGELARRGTVTSMADGLIAATALVHGYRLATRNVDDFKPFGVEMVNPWQA
jgi:predicted nucleic acid-binding protein